MSPQRIAILGSTGSIGVSTLQVIELNPERFSVFALSCFQNTDLFLEQCRKFKPVYAVVADEQKHAALKQNLQQAGLSTELLSGEEGLQYIASHDQVDQVMAGIVGAAGLEPTLAAAQAGKRVLLANKEALVMSGKLFIESVAQSGAELMPIDSEHNAIYQCLPGGTQGIEKILLTGSGGPFRTTPTEQLAQITPEQACNHPNWDMGKKISVDSSTMMNKGLEYIEACWLFDVPSEQIEIVVHPQSIVHSMVSYTDGSVLAQMGNPDMRTPIAHAMAWPERTASGVQPLDFKSIAALEFEAPDENHFPAIRIAREAYQVGGVASIVLNAANEVAVEAFLQKQISYTGICSVVEDTLQANISGDETELGGILAVDRETRRIATGLIGKEPSYTKASAG